MDNLTHQQAQRWLMNHAPLDARRQALLERHLQECAECRGFAAAVRRVETGLPAVLLPNPDRIPDERRAAQAIRRRQENRRPPRTLSSVLRELSYALAAVLLVLGLGYLLRTVLVNPPLAAGEPPVGGAEASATPTPFLALNMQSPAAEVRQRIFEPHWQTISALGVVTLAPAGDALPSSRYVQVWLDRSGAGRVLIADWMNYAINFSPDLTPIDRFASDGIQVARYDLTLGGYDPTMQNPTWYQHPLENVSPVTQMLFPGIVNFGSVELQVESEEFWGDRPVLVAVWSVNRLWLDARSGMLLQWEQTLLDGSTQTVRLISFKINPLLPGDLSRLDGLELLGFQPLESQPPIAEATQMPYPTPLPDTAAPQEPFNPDQVVLTVVDRNLTPLVGNEASIAGDVYLLLRQLQPPFQRSLGHVQAACLMILNDCPVEVIPGYPEASDNPLTWSPDGRWGVLPEPTMNRVLLYDSLEKTWRVAIEYAFVPVNLVRWSPDGAWFAVILGTPGAEDGLLTAVRLDGSDTRALAPDLGGLQVPVGWAGPDQVVFLHQMPVRKGDTVTSDPPLLYMADLQEGSYRKLPFEGNYDWLKSYPALSPDGSRLVLPLSAGADMQVAAFDGAVLNSIGTTGFQQSWSPDGQWIALVDGRSGGNRLVVIPAGGGEVKQVYEYAGPVEYHWTADSRHLLVQTWPAGVSGLEDASALRLISLEQGWIRRLQPNAPDGAYELVYPSISP